MIRIKVNGRFHDSIAGKTYTGDCQCGCKFEYDLKYPLFIDTDKNTNITGHYVLCPDCGRPLGVIYDEYEDYIACFEPGMKGRFIALFNDYCNEVLLRRRYFGRNKTKTW